MFAQGMAWTAQETSSWCHDLNGSALFLVISAIDMKGEQLHFQYLLVAECNLIDEEIWAVACDSNNVTFWQV